ncbi:DNA polymerase III subunit delta [Thalassotalea profundi]|uniref:DNA polymerase III subunit delta n=1 Tax=Thalassotalea profundi TaxID=2036687 RepID=A0ABQ3IG48_9GAMM|nr:DNA polymerase III subunit delta [Thalassotalea profundi]GHE80064.1 DNA polymerase III subunit delta [Thalassotalea profundi]
MRIYHNQVANTLNKNMAPIWLIFGDEPWQKNDALSQIKHQAQQQGFSELIRFYVDDKFDWSLLEQEYNSLSLFSNQRMIELELSSNKIGDVGSKKLIQLCDNLSPDILLILHGAKLDAANQKRKWFKAVESKGVFLPIYDIEGKQLSQWIYQQAQQLNLNLHQDLTLMLAKLFEGNLLALSQELAKLSLLFQQQQVSVEDAENIIIKQAKFSAFQLTDSMLKGDINKCITMLEQLQQEGIAVAQLIWPIHKEISQLLAMQEQLSQGKSLSELYSQYRIWDKRKPLYKNALTQISASNLAHAQIRLAQTDLITKTSVEFNGYILLADVISALYHGESLHKLSLNYEFS